MTKPHKTKTVQTKHNKGVVREWERTGRECVNPELFNMDVSINKKRARKDEIVLTKMMFGYSNLDSLFSGARVVVKGGVIKVWLSDCKMPLENWGDFSNLKIVERAAVKTTEKSEQATSTSDKTSLGASLKPKFGASSTEKQSKKGGASIGFEFERDQERIWPLGDEVSPSFRVRLLPGEKFFRGAIPKIELGVLNDVCAGSAVLVEFHLERGDVDFVNTDWDQRKLSVDQKLAAMLYTIRRQGKVFSCGYRHSER